LPTLRQNRRLANPSFASRSGRGCAASMRLLRGDRGETRASRWARFPGEAERRAAALPPRRRRGCDRPTTRVGCDSRCPRWHLRGDLRRGDGCRGTRLLRSKKFRYSGRLGLLRSALSELLEQHRSHGPGRSAMRKMRAPKLSSNRSVSEIGAHRTLRANTRDCACETSAASRVAIPPQRTSQRPVAVLSEFFVGNRGSNDSVGGGIPLAVALRRVGATQGARRPNEETA